MSAIVCRTYDPPPPLREQVLYVWEHAGHWRNESDFLLPDVGADIAIRLAGEMELGMDGDWVAAPNRLLVATLDKAIHFRRRGWTWTIGIRLNPGNTRLLGAPACALHGVVAAVSEVSPTLDRQLAEFSEAALNGKRSVLDLWPILLSNDKGSGDGACLRAASLLAQTSHLSVQQLSRELGLSSRHIARRFRAEVGLTLSDFRRIGRFSRAVELCAQQPRSEWSAIASDAGYFDQSHLIRDFRSITGESPSRLFSPAWYANFAT